MAAAAAAAAAGADGGEGEELLLLSAVEAGNGGGGGAPAAAGESWRLNFEGFRPPEGHQQDRPPAGALHHCLGVLGPPLCLSHWYCFASMTVFFPCVDFGFDRSGLMRPFSFVNLVCFVRCNSRFPLLLHRKVAVFFLGCSKS